MEGIAEDHEVAHYTTIMEGIAEDHEVAHYTKGKAGKEEVFFCYMAHHVLCRFVCVVLLVFQLPIVTPL
jgi:hypothetical protein